MKIISAITDAISGNGAPEIILASDEEIEGHLLQEKENDELKDYFILSNIEDLYRNGEVINCIFKHWKANNPNQQRATDRMRQAIHQALIDHNEKALAHPTEMSELEVVVLGMGNQIEKYSVVKGQGPFPLLGADIKYNLFSDTGAYCDGTFSKRISNRGYYDTEIRILYETGINEVYVYDQILLKIGEHNLSKVYVFRRGKWQPLSIEEKKKLQNLCVHHRNLEEQRRS